MNKTTKILLIVLGILILLGIIAFLFRDRIERWFFRPTATNIPAGVAEANTEVTTKAQNLNVPWEVLFIPNSSDMLVTERGGTLKRISATDEQVYSIQGVEHVGEGGLLGAALHPDFVTNSYIYLYYTTNQTGSLTNTIERYILRNDALTDKKVIISNIPAAANHDGGRAAFGPDGHLYITTGDAANPDLAQDKNSLAGKILRLTGEGTVPADNPFNNVVYSYGHRNPQGLAWDDKGQLWATEHGPSGSPKTGCDELNLITKGTNYGWPIIMCAETKAGMASPVIQSGTEDTWAPAGMAYDEGSLYFAGLRGESLYRAEINADNTVSLTTNFREQYGRMRAVTLHDSALYISTSNTDGRGTPQPGDDKVICIPLALFK